MSKKGMIMRLTKILHGKMGLALLLGALIAAGSLVVWGHGGSMMKWGQQGFGMHGGMMSAMVQTHVQHMVKELDLSDPQKGEIRNLVSQNRDRFTADFQAVSDAHKALHARIIGATTNITAAALAPQAESLAQAVAQAAADTANLFRQIHAVLTPEQRAKAETLHQQMPGHFSMLLHSDLFLDAVLNAVK